VFVPAVTATLHDLDRIAAALTPPGGLAKAVACVPGRWAMIAVSGPDPDTACALADAIVTAALAQPSTQ
jgi:hypothetical protein